MPEMKSIENSPLRINHEEFLGIVKEILARGKPLSFRAQGTSMSPFIKDGDIVTLLRDPNPKVGVGDVVLLKTGEGKFYLHRVIKKGESGIITRGDACFEDDGFTPHRNIIGKVVRVSGRGYNFHLRHPIKKLISKRLIFTEGLYRHSFLLKLGKKIANALG